MGHRGGSHGDATTATGIQIKLDQAVCVGRNQCARLGGANAASYTPFRWMPLCNCNSQKCPHPISMSSQPRRRERERVANE